MLSCAVRPGNPGRRQPIPGNEPPQVSARAAGGGFDHEAGGPDRPLRVAVRPAATRDPGPCRLDQVLQSSAPRALGPDVLEPSLRRLAMHEAQLATSPDPQFRFHSGPPAQEMAA